MALGIISKVSEIANMLRTRARLAEGMSSSERQRAEEFIAQAMQERRDVDYAGLGRTTVEGLSQSTVGGGIMEGGVGGSAATGGGTVPPTTGVYGFSYPWQVLVRDSGGGKVVEVNPASKVFETLGASSAITVTGLGTAVSVGAFDIYLEWTFSTWPTINTITLLTGTMGPASEDDGTTQTTGRRKIAKVVSVGSGEWAVDQFVTTQLRPEFYNLNGMLIYHLLNY